ncbi:LppP/LprE family lipoprotein [Mycolicibacillus parakoreensis]|nr:LppP/LprE family lipoprotein [Mycolicibacillus parakoreensis]
MVTAGRSSRWIAGPGVILLAWGLAACGSGDSTVAKTPTPTTTIAEPVPESSTAASSSPPSSSPPPGPADPCAVNLAAPTVARAVSELPRDPRSGQPWNPEPLAGNYNECAQLSAVIVAANTNAEHPNTRAVMFHLGKFIPEGVPDTYGFTGIDTAQCTGDTVALTYSTGLAGLDSVVKFRWNGNGVELIANSVR